MAQAMMETRVETEIDASGRVIRATAGPQRSRPLPRKWEAYGAYASRHGFEAANAEVEAGNLRPAQDFENALAHLSHSVKLADKERAQIERQAQIGRDAFVEEMIQTELGQYKLDIADREPVAGFSAMTSWIGERAELYAKALRPARDEFDTREIADEASPGIVRALAKALTGICQQGTQLGDELPALFDGVIRAFNARIKANQTMESRMRDEIRDLERAADGTEIANHALELALNRSQVAGDKITALRGFLNILTEEYQEATGEVWQPQDRRPAGQGTTAAALEARKYLADAKAAQYESEVGPGTRIGFTGPREGVWRGGVEAALDAMREKHPDMVLVHNNLPGADQDAARWAKKNSVAQLICEPDWDKYPRNAGFVRNREDFLEACRPREIIVIRDRGLAVQGNLLQEAAARGVPCIEVRNVGTADGPTFQPIEAGR